MSSRFQSLPGLRRIPAHGILLVDDDALESRTRKDILGRQFPSVERVRSAADALICLDNPVFMRKTALILVELHNPDLPGPEFVRELIQRAPDATILVIGQPGESAADYPAVQFLPRTVSTAEVVGAVRTALAARMPKAA